VSDNASTYPTATDPALVDVVDDVDYLPADALHFAVNQVAALQSTIGNDPADQTAIGGQDYGTLGALLIALCRVETGTFTLVNSKTGARVSFTAGRFSAPPIVMLQFTTTTEPGVDDVYTAKRVTTDGFVVGSGYTTRSAAAGKTVNWLAFQPPFGIEEDQADTYN